MKFRSVLFGRIVATLALASATITVASAGIPASPSSFIGTWYAKDPDGSLVKVVIGGSGSNLTVNPYGDCSPNPCDDGTQPLAAVVDKRDDSPGQVSLGQATFTFSFKTMLVHVEAIDDGQSPPQIAVRQTSTFTDKSGRENYETTERFVRAVTSHHANPFVGYWSGDWQSPLHPGASIPCTFHIVADGPSGLKVSIAGGPADTHGGYLTFTYSGDDADDVRKSPTSPKLHVSGNGMTGKFPPEDYYLLQKVSK